MLHNQKKLKHVVRIGRKNKELLVLYTTFVQKEEHGSEHLPCICICMASDIRTPEPEDMVWPDPA